ncbi:MAG: MFS transporter [Dehalococcoidia bacterium]|nr:MFS transporter [Dehalococcoidia bacterium]
MNLTKSHGVIPKSEFRAYCIAALGNGMIYGLMSSFISDFYISVLRVGPLFVLFLMLCARIWDAVSDPIMGMIIDCNSLKSGKMKPYIKMAVLPVAVLTLLIFCAPDLSMGLKMVYAVITYVLWGMAYTITDVPFWSLPNIMTPKPEERGKLLSFATAVNGVGVAVPAALFMGLGYLLPNLISQGGLELERTKYLIVALIAAGVGIFLYLRALKVKERIALPLPQKRDNGTSEALRLVFRCKPLMLTVIMGILAAGRYLYQAGAIHVARYAVYIGPSLDGLSTEDIESALQANISTVALVYSIAVGLGMLVTMLVVSMLIPRFNYKQIIIFSCILGSAASFGMYLIGYERFWLCVPLLVLTGIPLGAINALVYPMIGDALDYMEWKTGVRYTGIGQACMTFTQKLGNAVATSSIVLMYMLIRLDIHNIGIDNTVNVTELSSAVRGGMFSLVSLIPAISLLVCMVPIFFYNLTGDKKERITRELAQQRKAKGIEIADGISVP